MNIIIKNREIENINFYKNPDAILYPTDQINPETLLLKGFTWRNKPNVLSKIKSKLQLHYTF